MYGEKNTINEIDSCTFINNTSPIGGSIYLTFPGSLNISRSIFINNSANLGAAIYFEQRSKFKFDEHLKLH